MDIGRYMRVVSECDKIQRNLTRVEDLTVNNHVNINKLATKTKEETDNINNDISYLIEDVSKNISNISNLGDRLKLFEERTDETFKKNYDELDDKITQNDNDITLLFGKAADANQRLTDIEGVLPDKANKTHKHVIKDITDLQDKLKALQNNIDEKANKTHTHTSFTSLNIANASITKNNITINNNNKLSRIISEIDGKHVCLKLDVDQYSSNNGSISLRQMTSYFNSVIREAKLLDYNGNTSFPGTLTASNVANDNETRLAAAETKIETVESDLANKADAKHTHNSSDITFNSNIIFTDSGTDTREIRLVAGKDDCGRIAVGATGTSQGWMEIATADDKDESIYVRQYKYDNHNHFDHIGREAVLLDASGNTSFPGTLTASNVANDNETRLAAAETKIETVESDLANKANTNHKHNSSDITFNSSISFKNNSLDPRSITFQSGNNDNGRILFGSTETDAGYLEIATADNGNEPIYVRQYMGPDFNTKKMKPFY